jgi:hypothetical protein
LYCIAFTAYVRYELEKFWRTASCGDDGDDDDDDDDDDNNNNNNNSISCLRSSDSKNLIVCSSLVLPLVAIEMRKRQKFPCSD